MATRVGWCPGALRPMRSGDGLLVRVKPHGGVLSFAQAKGLADLAEACGNGLIDLTSRANLQLRGVSDATMPDLLAGLGRLGLLDADPEAEAVRNIVASPLAGLDGTAAVDIRPVVAALERQLAADPDCRRLPAKWSTVVDDGGLLSLDGIVADVRFTFAAKDQLWMGLGDSWAAVPSGGLSDALSGLARFVATRGPARTRDLLREVGVDRLFTVAGLVRSDAGPVSRPLASMRDLLGDHGMDGSFVGVAPAFGSLDHKELAGVATASRRVGTCGLRLTPWRAILVTLPRPSTVIASEGRRSLQRCNDPSAAGIATAAPPSPLATPPSCAWRGSWPAPPRNGGERSQAAKLAGDLAALGLIVDGDDPRLRVIACTGAPGCHRGTTSTRADAAAFAKWIDGGTDSPVHISGCTKGCARPAAAPWTFVGRDGRYDLVRDGTAGDAPLAAGLSFNEALARVGGAMRADAPLGLP